MRPGRQPNLERHQAIYDAYANDPHATFNSVGRQFGLSRQRTHKIVTLVEARLRNAGQEPPSRERKYYRTASTTWAPSEPDHQTELLNYTLPSGTPSRLFHLSLPADLTRHEAARLSRFIGTLVVDGHTSAETG